MIFDKSRTRRYNLMDRQQILLGQLLAESIHGIQVLFPPLEDLKNFGRAKLTELAWCWMVIAVCDGSTCHCPHICVWEYGSVALTREITAYCEKDMSCELYRKRCIRLSSVSYIPETWNPRESQRQSKVPTFR